jgi:hypothetical protein
MRRAIKYRATYITTLWKHRVFSSLFVLFSFLYTLFSFWRDELATVEQQEWRPIKMLPHWPISWWIAITLGAIIIWLFEASFREGQKLHRRIDELEQNEASPLEILFDPNNTLGRFWSIETPECKYGPQSIPNWEYRVEIKNNSSKTIRNVSLESEFIGQIPEGPFEHTFDKTNKTYCDLKPKCSAFITVLRWPARPQPGMLAGSGAVAYGPIKITASADDTKQSIRIFNFDYQKEPMIYD